jgi:hypothetical protein
MISRLSRFGLPVLPAVTKTSIFRSRLTKLRRMVNAQAQKVRIGGAGTSVAGRVERRATASSAATAPVSQLVRSCPCATGIRAYCSGWLCVCATLGHEPALCRSSHDWQATRCAPNPASFHFAWPKAIRKNEMRVSRTTMVVMQSCVHRDMLDGEQVASKALKLDL